MPPIVTQVTGTGFDTNVFGLVPDADGVTCWAFQDEAGAAGIDRYARFSLVNGSIVHAGVTFGNSYPSAQSLQLRTDTSVFWAQDNGQYYTLSLNPSNANHLTLYKFHIAASAGGASEVLGTYSTTTASFDLHTKFTSPFATQLIAWTQGSNHYVAVHSTNSATVAVFDDTLTLIGTYAHLPGPNGNETGQTIFADKNGDLWITAWVSPNLILSYWHPANGATAFVLNATDTLISNTTTGFPLTNGDNTAYVRYVPSNHSVMLGDFGTTFPQYSTNLSNVLLGTPGIPGSFTRTNFRANDGSFFLNMIASNAPYDCTDLEMTVTQPSGKLAIQNDTTGPAFNTQIGGLYSVIDPITLVADLGYPVDITATILGSLAPAPPQDSYSDHGTVGLHYAPFANMVWSEVNASLAVTYAHNDYSTGSALYLITSAPTTPILDVAPLTLSYLALQGGSNPATQTISIANDNGGTLNWTAVSDQSWLHVGTASGTGNASNVISVTTGALAIGTYTGHVTVTAAGATASPQVVTVTFVVTAIPTIFAQVVPDQIMEGDSAVLSWTSTNATTLTSNEFGLIALTGSMVVSPLSTSYYHFHAVGLGGTADAAVVLEVLSNEAAFNLQKVVLTLKQDRIPVRGKS